MFFQLRYLEVPDSILDFEASFSTSERRERFIFITISFRVFFS